MIANNRRHMASLLDDRMHRSKAKLHAAGKGDRDSTRIKTYFIEAMLPETETARRTGEFIDSLFPRLGGADVGSLVVSRSKEDTVASIETVVAGEAVVAYLDFTNSRFWQLHSMAKSDALDRLVDWWVDDLPELDRAWFPVGLLDKYAELGPVRGIGLEYSNKWIKRSDGDAGEADVFAMQVRSRQASRVLQTMRSKAGEPHAARLSKVVVEALDGAAVSAIKFDGKITGHGKSFDDHVAVTTRVYEQYADQVRHVESDYAIGGSQADQSPSAIEGSPITFLLQKPVEDLPLFCDRMFSGAGPFRLWGQPIRVKEDFFRVQAVDLHSARTVACELSKTFIRVYLPRGSCGNSVLRMFTNLQANYDALVQAVNGDGGPVFGF